jgi:hypothetical protein
MSAEKREQVFISSTFKDLMEERRAVIQTLLEADCIPAGMELFPASDKQKLDLIKGVIDLCDYYVVIIGGRYGSVDAEAALSYTEMEFDYAVTKGVPVMGFLHGDPGKIAGEKLDLDPKLRKKLDAFRQKIEMRMVKYWNTQGDLPGQVALAVMQIRKSHPAIGWIRASEAMTPEVKAELAELRAKVRELTADLKDEQRQHAAGVDPAELVQGDERIRLDCILTYHRKSAVDSGKAYSYNQDRGRWNVEPTWNEVFGHLGPELMDEASEEYLHQRLSALCLEMAREELLDDDTRDEDDQIEVIYDAEVTIKSFNDVKVQFAALSFIENGKKRRPGSDTSTYWLLTERGKQTLLNLRAIRRAPIPEASGQGDTPEIR